MSLSFRIVHDGISPGLAKAARRFGDAKPILRVMGVALESYTTESFTDPSKRIRPWAPKKDGRPSNLMSFSMVGKYSSTTSLLRTASTISQGLFGRHDTFATGLRNLANAMKGRPGATALGRAGVASKGLVRLGTVGFLAVGVMRTGKCLGQQVANEF